MKRYKSIIAVLAAVILISSLIACTQKAPTETVTQAVTNENGEFVTDENGELVTEEIEAQIVTDKNGNAVTEVVTDGDGKPVTTVKDGEYVNVTQVVTQSASSGKTTAKSGSKTTAKNAATKKSGKKDTTKAPTKKPSAPPKVAKISAGSITENSLKLTWSKVKCSGYQVQYSADGVNFTYLTKNTAATGLTVDGLTSYTQYTFRVRAFNKNSAGTTTGKWNKTTATTKASDANRKITFNILLPMNGNKEDTLIIKVGDDKYEEKVTLDGSTFTLKTSRKYKGAVKYNISYKSSGLGVSGRTDKEVCEVDLTATGIYIIDGEDD